MKKCILLVAIFFLKIIYSFMKIFPAKNRIVMISRQSNKVNMDFKLLGEELSKKYEVVYLCKTLENGVNSSFKSKISYGFHMLMQMRYLATSKVCVLDSYSPAVSVLNHKKSLTVIQIWHSVGTMKKFGYTSLDKKEGSKAELARIMKMHNNYDLVFASSLAYVDHLASGFNIDKSKIKIFTLPRIDLLKDKKYESKIRKKIYDKYPELDSKKQNIVYCPTFRKNDTNFNKKLDELVNCIDYNKYNFILKKHPLSKVVVNNDKVITDSYFSSFDMLFIADKVITDYSCILYEAGVRNIPLYFYCYDLDDYEVVRGLALDYKELPGYSEKDAKGLALDLDKKYDMDYLKKFIDKYVTNTKNCTNKMINEIIKYME